ncbi:uncharacterized protein [Palaemon carinicauda]|uniref:uncharacterized protein n=1 Tax=Palaemon carinicauda TaxID=392227 RepID=UPI0035B5B8DC
MLTVHLALLHFLHFSQGPLPTSQVHRYLFTIIDCSTCWPEAVPMETTTPASCTSALLLGWIARFGINEHIIPDRGTTFTSQLRTSLTNLLVITHYQTTAYNPVANGMVELFNRSLKAALMSRCKDSNWFTQLPWVLLGLRTSPKDDLDFPAAEMVYGDPLVVLAKFFPSVISSYDLQHIRHIVGKFTPCRQTHKLQQSTIYRQTCICNACLPS